MAYDAFIELIDRLSAKSNLRGSTASYLGVIGTLLIFVICFIIYIPAAERITKGDYFETEFYNYKIQEKEFYTDTDLKVAIVFRNRKDNSVANHTQILDFAYTFATQLLGDYSDYFREDLLPCEKNYFKGTLNPIEMEDCLIFPHNIKFNMLFSYGGYSYLSMFFFPRTDSNPFSVSDGFSGFQSQFVKYMEKYYYQVLFTSKIIDGKGNEQLQLHRYYSTENEVSSEVATSTNVIDYVIKNSTLDISIMPWVNKQKHQNLVWLGGQWNLYQDSQEDSARYGVSVYLYKSPFNAHSFRYYKKLDLLVGAIGGAMLLVYILLWIPFNYINKTLHQIRNAQALLLEHRGKDDEPVLEQNIYHIQFTFRVWLANPLFNRFFKSFKKQSDIIEQGEKELDIVNFVKQMKVIDRTLKKKQLEQSQSDKKILILKQEGGLLQQQLKELKESKNEQSVGDIQGMNEEEIEQEQGQIIPEFYKQEDVDHKYGLTNEQLEYLKTEPANDIFATHMTLMAINADEHQTTQLKQIQSKERWRGKYVGIVSKKISKKLFSGLCNLIEKLDFFGAKPNLLAKPFDSSIIGCIGTGIIILFSLLIAGTTLANSNTPQFELLEELLPEDNFKFTLTSGKNLKFVFCSSSISRLVGSARAANFLFFVQRNHQRTYYLPETLTTSDLSQYDLTRTQFGYDLRRCFRMPSSIQVDFAKQPGKESYLGIRIEPFCSSTFEFCQNNKMVSEQNFLKYINDTYNYLFFPENRYDEENDKLINNLRVQQLNINYRYMNNLSSFEETVYLDQVQVLDDTQNYFMRQEPIVRAQSIRINPNTPYSVSTSINRTQNLIYYQAKIKASSLQAKVIISTPKSDVILGIIGGIFVIMYAIFHWIGKVYNNFNFRARLAEVIYDQESIYESFLLKYLAISPLPTCAFPTCFDIRYTISRMREIDKKIVNDLDYLWLVKYMKSCFNLSSALFNRIQQRQVSQVYVKEKLDQGQLVCPPKQQERHIYNEQQFMDQDVDGQQIEEKMRGNNSKNKIKNFMPQESKEEISLQNTVQKEQNADDIQPNKYINTQVKQELNQNYFHGHQKPLPIAALDTYQYKSSFTFQGKREVTSCVGGFCCLILVMFIAIIISFELNVFLQLQDTKVGKTTYLMQPLESESTDVYNSKINLHSGTNFKLALTFSAYYTDYAHNVSSYINNGIGVDIFQSTSTKINGSVVHNVTVYPMVPCVPQYITSWLNTLIDPKYYIHTQYGYCVPDGLDLSIQGLPEDKVKKSFTLSIYDKTNSTEGTTTLKKFLNTYNPKYHFSYPYPQIKDNDIEYEITSFMFDHLNITKPTQQNITLSKRIVSYEGEVKDKTKPQNLITYVANTFQQQESTFTSNIDSNMYYNLTFDNSYLVELYTVKGPQKEESFGLFGGVIAILIFGFGIFPRAYNNYRMKYLIGRQLYIFDMLVAKKKKNILRGKLKKSKEESNYLKYINNYNEWKIFLSFLASFAGGIIQNYNLTLALRHITLIEQKVQKDISLYEVYKNLHKYRDILNEELSQRAKHEKVADIFGKSFFNEDPQDTNLEGMNNIKNHARKSNWTAWEEHAVIQAIRTRVKINDIFDNAFLERAFNIQINTNASVYGSQLPGTIGFGTSQNNSQVVSELQRQQFEIQ